MRLLRTPSQNQLTLGLLQRSLLPQLRYQNLLTSKSGGQKIPGPFRAKPERAKPEHTTRPVRDKPKFERKPHFARDGQHDDKRNGKRGGKPERKVEARPPAPEKPLDPNSPFAKLMVLKEQMKGN